MTGGQDADRVYYDILRRKTGEERLLLGMELYEIAFKTMQDGIRHQHPGWDAAQIRAETMKRFSRASGRIL